MNKYSKLSVIALSLLACTACSMNKPASKAQENATKQESVAPETSQSESKAVAAKREKLLKALDKYGDNASYLTAKEYEKYSQTPIENYGQKVDVNGKKMNIYTVGQGKVPIVFIPGQGTITAKYQYHNLISNLSKNHKVVVVEPFGSGLSDVTDKERTLDNITSEIHTALQKAGITGKYVIAAHSIGGVYAVKYIHDYPNEVAGFMGLDSSTPGMESGQQVGYQQTTMKELPRIPDVSEEINAQYYAIGHKIINNANMLSEAKNSSNMINESANYKIPKGIPAMYLLARESDLALQLRSLDMPIKGTWEEQHTAMSENPKDVTNHLLEGTHQIYDTNLKEVMKYMNQFMEKFEK